MPVVEQRENLGMFGDKPEAKINYQWTFVIGEGYVDNDDLEAEKA